MLDHLACCTAAVVAQGLLYAKERGTSASNYCLKRRQAHALPPPATQSTSGTLRQRSSLLDRVKSSMLELCFSESSIAKAAAAPTLFTATAGASQERQCTPHTPHHASTVTSAHDTLTAKLHNSKAAVALQHAGDGAPALVSKLITCGRTSHTQQHAARATTYKYVSM